MIMNKNNEILNYIQDDLKIRTYNGEKLEQYISRTVYSALGMWIRTSTLDEDILNEDFTKVGVSKIHIINRCKLFLENMIEIYPEINNWFNTNKGKNPIEITRKRLYNAGELLDVGYKTDVALPYYEECVLNTSYKVIRGLQKGDFKNAIGLSQIENLSLSDLDNKEIFEFYGLNSKRSIEILNEYLNGSKWNKKKEFSGEYFNKYSNKIFSNCWESGYILKNNDITLYKNGILDYGFIKKENNEIYSFQISKHLISKYEVRRFMYALKSRVNNKVNAKFKRYYNDKLVMLKLYNTLPQKEENILMLIGWPVNNIDDKFHLIFNENCWGFVEEILSNLDIKLEEELYE